jgi:hypothetical protein
MFPLDLWDWTMLFAVVAMILLATSEVLHYYNGNFSILIDRKRLRIAAVGFSLIFLIAISLRIATILLER